jgi:hypothetical protein
MNKLIALASILAALTLAACNQSQPEGTAEVATNVASNCPIADDSGSITIAPGLTARVLKSGYGRAAVNGDYADTNVWLWQFDEAAQDSHGSFIWESGNDIFQFQLGSGQVIKGWDLGVPCMLEGETRELIVASDLAYGASGRGDAVPPNTTLIFTIELVKLTSPE